MDIYKITLKILDWEPDKKQKIALALAEKVKTLLKENKEMKSRLNDLSSEEYEELYKYIKGI